MRLCTHRTFFLIALVAISKAHSIDMHTNLYHAPDVLMPAIHKLVRKELMDIATKYFKISDYMKVCIEGLNGSNTN